MNCVLITSVIHTINSPLSYTKTRSFYSHDDRIKQTQYTIETIKKHVPNYYIVLIEGSNIDNITNMFDVDYIHKAYLEKRCKNAVESKFKGLGEVNLLLSYFNSENFKSNDFNSISKISGRYYFNNNFKFINKSFTCRINHATWFFTNYYCIDKSLINKFIDILNKILNDSNIQSSSIEHLFKKYVDGNILNKLDRLNVDGNIAVNGEFVAT
jgi:hypothetical protein